MSERTRLLLTELNYRGEQPGETLWIGRPGSDARWVILESEESVDGAQRAGWETAEYVLERQLAEAQGLLDNERVYTAEHRGYALEMRDRAERAEKALEDERVASATYLDVARFHKEARERAEKALVEIISELGVPDANYPAPVANAVEIAKAALAFAQTGGLDA